MITEKLRDILKALEGKYPPPSQAHHSITFARDGSKMFGFKDLLHLNLLNGGVWHIPTMGITVAWSPLRYHCIQPEHAFSNEHDIRTARRIPEIRSPHSCPPHRHAEGPGRSQAV